MLDFNLRVFLAAAKTRSFTRAAEILNISQPAVTHQIKNLESHLKTSLFRRTGNRIQLTEAGRVLLTYAEDIQQLYLRASRDILEKTGQVAGEIHFGATHLLGKYYLPRMVGEFRKRDPDASLSMLVANSQEIVQYLRDGFIELAVVSEPLHVRGMTAIPFYRDRLTVIVYPGHRWCDAGEIETADLFDEDFIAREPGSGTREVYTRFLEGVHKGRSLRTVMVFGSTEAIKTGVMGEMGFSIVSRLACRLETEQGLLREIRLKDLDMKRDFHIVFRSAKHLSLPALKFKDYLVKKSELAPGVAPVSP